jgi:hypothetical protein
MKTSGGRAHEKKPRTVKKVLVKNFCPMVREVHGFTYTKKSKSRFFSYRTPGFPDIFVGWATYLSVEQIFEAFLEAPRRAEKQDFLWALSDG